MKYAQSYQKTVGLYYTLNKFFTLLKCYKNFGQPNKEKYDTLWLLKFFITGCSILWVLVEFLKIVKNKSWSYKNLSIFLKPGYYLTAWVLDWILTEVWALV